MSKLICLMVLLYTSSYVVVRKRAQQHRTLTFKVLSDSFCVLASFYHTIPLIFLVQYRYGILFGCHKFQVCIISKKETEMNNEFNTLLYFGSAGKHTQTLLITIPVRGFSYQLTIYIYQTIYNFWLERRLISSSQAHVTLFNFVLHFKRFMAQQNL